MRAGCSNLYLLSFELLKEEFVTYAVYLQRVFIPGIIFQHSNKTVVVCRRSRGASLLRCNPLSAYSLRETSKSPKKTQLLFFSCSSSLNTTDTPLPHRYQEYSVRFAVLPSFFAPFASIFFLKLHRKLKQTNSKQFISQRLSPFSFHRTRKSDRRAVASGLRGGSICESTCNEHEGS